MTGPRAGVRLIWAQARGGVIGRDGDMPWHLPEDLAHFRRMTLGAPVVMGRRTWESFPPRFRPLPGRRNIVCTRDSGWVAAGAECAGTPEAALALAGPDAWVIGGGSLYEATLPVAGECVVTQIDAEVDGDTWAPRLTAGNGWEAVETGPWLISEGGWVRPARDGERRTPVRYRIVRYGRWRGHPAARCVSP